MGIFTTTQQQKSRSMKIFHFRHLPRQIHAKITFITKGLYEKANSLLTPLLIFGRKKSGPIVLSKIR